MKIAYGHDYIDIPIEPSIVYDPPRVLAQASALQLIEQHLPVIQKTFHQYKWATAAILVEDQTNYNPELPALLKILLDQMDAANIFKPKLVVAYGTHHPHTKTEHEELYGKTNLKRLELVEHDCRNRSSLASMGHFGGLETLYLNQHAVNANLLVSISTVTPHTLSGFTGGPSIVLPGIAKYENILQNLAKLCHTEVKLGQLENNPILQGMQHACSFLDIPLSLQIIRSSSGNLLACYVGRLQKAFDQAVAYWRDFLAFRVDTECDLCVVSCGGAPRDDSLYNALRALATAEIACRPKGRILVVGEFPSGVGNATLVKWLNKPRKELLNIKPEALDLGIHSALLLARNLAKYEVAFYCHPKAAQALQELGLFTISTQNQVKTWIENTKPEKACCIPDGSSTLLIDN